MPVKFLTPEEQAEEDAKAAEQKADYVRRMAIYNTEKARLEALLDDDPRFKIFGKMRVGDVVLKWVRKNAKDLLPKLAKVPWHEAKAMYDGEDPNDWIEEHVGVGLVNYGATLAGFRDYLFAVAKAVPPTKAIDDAALAFKKHEAVLTLTKLRDALLHGSAVLRGSGENIMFSKDQTQTGATRHITLVEGSLDQAPKHMKAKIFAAIKEGKDWLAPLVQETDALAAETWSQVVALYNEATVALRAEHDALCEQLDNLRP